MSIGIRFEKLTVRLGEREILRGLDAELEASALNVIVGPNGAGKSTLVRASLGMLPVESGRVVFGERELGEFSRRELARSAALVPQDTRLDFSFRVDEVVDMGRYPHLGPLERVRAVDRNVVAETLARLDLEGLADRDVTTLSEGESQRVLIARALATEAKVLFLDEPISHLDIAHRLRILELLGDLCEKGYTVVAVLHDLDLAMRYADHVLVIAEGKTAGAGDPTSILKEAVLQRVFDVEIERVTGKHGSYLAFTRPVTSSRNEQA